MHRQSNLKRTMRLLLRFAPYFKKYWGALALDLFCASLTSVCDLVLPLIVRDITNAGVDDIASLTVQRILTTVLFYIGLRCIDAAAQYYMTSGGHVMGAKIENDMRSDLFAHLQELSFSYYDNTKIGQLMSRLTTDLFDVTEFAHHFPENLFIAVIKITVGFIIFARMDVLLALIIFAVLPLMLFVTKRSRSQMRAASRERRHQVGEIHAQTEDSLLGIRVVKSFANEHIEEDKFSKGTRRWFKIRKRGFRYMATFHTLVRMLDGTMYIIVVATGAFLMRAGRTTPGDFSASLLLVSTLLASIRSIVEFSEQFTQGITGIERFFEVMDEIPEVTQREGAVDITHTQGNIEFRDVGFYYPDTENYVLRHLNLTITPGNSVAIVGPSGAGKTTLCNLIPRFYDVVEGQILLDGRDIRDITLHSLRSQIGVVQQDVYLFSGSVYENIAYGKPGATLAEVQAAAEQSGAHEFIAQLPDGYDTYVGERGIKLSGGQKQRISIARVFLKNPPILILDEATSSLDNESERLVQKSLERLAKGRTTLTIAHRLTTIRGASEILVLTQDGIAEQGTHKELMAQQGVYRELYAMYTEMV